MKKNIFDKIKDKYLYIITWKKEIRREENYFKKGQELKYLKKWYKKHTGLNLNYENPKCFTDMQQVLKLNSCTPLITKCSDKFRVREYVESKFGDTVKMIPIIKNNGHYFFEDPEKISYDELPNQFVIQCNHGAHMTHIIKDKDALGKKGFNKLVKALKKELDINFAFTHGYELNYKNIKRGVFITKYLQDNNDLPDYKFFCTNGKLQFCWIDTNRQKLHLRATFNNEFKKADFSYGNNPMASVELDLDLMNRMKKIAETIAKDFIHVRVDMYYYHDEIYIGELTFTSGAGIELPNPPSMNTKMLQYLKVDMERIKNEKKY